MDSPRYSLPLHLPIREGLLSIKCYSKMVLEGRIFWLKLEQELLVFSKGGFTTMPWQSLDTKSTSTCCQSLTLLTVQVHILSGRTSINISAQNTEHSVTASEMEGKINVWSGKRRERGFYTHSPTQDTAVPSQERPQRHFRAPRIHFSFKNHSSPTHK